MLCVCSVASYPLRPHELLPTRFLCPWNFPGKNTGLSCHFLLQGILLTQRLNLHLLTGRLFTTETSEKPPRTMGNKLMRSDCGVQTRYNFWLQQRMCKCVSHFLPTGRVCPSDYQLEQNGMYCLGSEGKKHQ